MSTTNNPIPARTLVPDLLGDLNRAGLREIRLKHLVTLGEALGISGPTMRVTLARLRERGWFDVRKEGRESVYILTKASLRNLRGGARRLYHAAPPWKGEWAMAVYSVPESDRNTREEIRKRLSWWGFGSLATSTWIRPNPSLDDVEGLAASYPNATITALTTRTSGIAADRALITQCWDLEPQTKQYTNFVRQMRLRAPQLEEAELDPQASFTARIHLVNAYRILTKNDPHLPEALQPAGWKGDEARQLFSEAHERLATLSDAYYAEITNA